jgi:hypothetical protein
MINQHGLQLTWFIGGSLDYAGITPKWTASALQPLSGTSLDVPEGQW